MTNLSPAAQAVANAMHHYETNHWLTPREVAAIAIRAAADQVDWNWEPCSQLLAIADELEAK
jgi:hypothetical protein